MKNDLFSEDAFFRFDLEESATIEAVIVGSGAVAIFLYACHGNVITSKNGEPLVVFHGTDDYGFDTFDSEKSDDKLSFFTTNSKYIASTYTKFQPITSRQLRKYLIDNGAVELLKEGKYREFEKLFNTYYHNEDTIE